MRQGKVFLDGEFVDIETLVNKHKVTEKEILMDILKTLKSIEKELKQNAGKGTVTNIITKEDNKVK